MDTYTITEAYEIASTNEVPHWAVVMTAADGARRQHAFPKDTVLWRAVEYEIDPADTDTLLDIILHEPHITPEDIKAQPLTLTDAATASDARTAHLARIAEVKKRCQIRGIQAPTAKGGPDPLAPIRAHQHAPGRLAEIQTIVSAALPARTRPAHPQPAPRSD
jgi:hypothetical protein